MRRFVEVNEAAIFATGTAAEWWALFEARFTPAGRITVLTPSIGGNRVHVEVDDEEHAREFVAMLISHGVPKNAVKVKPAPLGWEHSCLYGGSHRCQSAHHSGKPTTKKCRDCGGQWFVLQGAYGVFTWRGDGRYRVEAAHATFASEARAQALADQHPRDNWVVRFLPESVL